MSSSNDLRAKYIYAATKNLPRKIRTDVEQELTTLIEDMLEARTGGAFPTEVDIRVVLTELGPPAKLATQYGSERTQYLIGPEYYELYKRIVLIVELCIATGLAVSSIFSAFLHQPDNFGVALLKWLGTWLSGAMSALGFITLLFAFFQQKNISIDTGAYNLDELPDVPAEKERVSLGGALTGIIFSVLFYMLLLIAPQWLGFFSTDGQLLPLLNIAYLHQMWFVFVISCIVTVGSETFSLLEGRYTMRLAGVNLAGNIVLGVLWAALLRGAPVLNPNLANAVGFASKLGGWPLLHANSIMLGIVVFSLVLDSASNFYYAYRYGKP